MRYRNSCTDRWDHEQPETNWEGFAIIGLREHLLVVWLTFRRLYFPCSKEPLAPFTIPLEFYLTDPSILSSLIFNCLFLISYSFLHSSHQYYYQFTFVFFPFIPTTSLILSSYFIYLQLRPQFSARLSLLPFPLPLSLFPIASLSSLSFLSSSFLSFIPPGTIFLTVSSWQAGHHHVGIPYGFHLIDVVLLEAGIEHSVLAVEESHNLWKRRVS